MPPSGFSFVNALPQVAEQLAGLPGVFLLFQVFAGIANKIAQMLYVGTRTVVEEFSGNRVALGNHPVAPALSQVVATGMLFTSRIERINSSLNCFRVIFLPDNLANILQVAALGFVLLDSARLFNGTSQSVANG